MFAEKLQVLGVVTHEEIKLEEALRGVSKPKKVVIEKKRMKGAMKRRWRVRRSPLWM